MNSTSDHLLHELKQPGTPLIPSASTVASAILNSSTSPVEFVQMIEYHHKSSHVLPITDFQCLFVEQLDLFRGIVIFDALLSVYVRPAGSYVRDRLYLRQVILYPVASMMKGTDIVLMIGIFNVSAGLCTTKAVLSNSWRNIAEEVAESSTVVPMVKHLFVVRFLAAEFPSTEHNLPQHPSPGEAYALSHLESNMKSNKIWKFKKWKSASGNHKLSVVQRLNAINIVRSLAMAY
ncbi:hypothetical protein MLD38_037878 [Melastoma candidum]|uniref:Uncharacterized protein n=1 Tax=Melastoma candidum TaxID=119954 RepID=A0ACB9KYL8_9MYRT|nr:hypothetical protein MLD38_037878 [Melastoma candidum]